MGDLVEKMSESLFFPFLSNFGPKSSVSPKNRPFDNFPWKIKKSHRPIRRIMRSLSAYFQLMTTSDSKFMSPKHFIFFLRDFPRPKSLDLSRTFGLTSWPRVDSFFLLSHGPRKRSMRSFPAHFEFMTTSDKKGVTTKPLFGAIYGAWLRNPTFWPHHQNTRGPQEGGSFLNDSPGLKGAFPHVFGPAKPADKNGKMVTKVRKRPLGATVASRPFSVFFLLLLRGLLPHQ